jgi:hypothetical protein
MTVRAAVAAIATTTALAVCLTFALLPVMLFIPILYPVVEVIFAVLYYYRYALLSYNPVKHRPLSHDPSAVFERVVEHLKQFQDIRRFLSVWFRGAKFSEIKRDNVAEMIAYAFWYKTL